MRIEDYKPGKASLSFQSWDDLLLFLATADTTGWVFRGQARESWGLRPSLIRLLKVHDEYKSDRDAEREAQFFFMNRASCELLNAPAQDDYLGWQFWMQHYGAPTRLLDWSGSPFVGVYFAYCDPEFTMSEPASL